MKLDEDRSVCFETLEGLTLSSVDHSNDSVTFRTTCGRTFRMFHDQDCCESVELEDISTSFDDLLGEPIITAQVATNDDTDQSGDLLQWTFYTLRNINTTVQLRWCGHSNGYYSIAVSFYELASAS